MNDKSIEAEIWYLFHSGFAVKTPGHFLIFDYYSDTPAGGRRSKRGLASGVINPDEIKDLDVLVFSSHSHADHYNPVIFDWGRDIPNIRYILSHDIKAAAKKENTLIAYPGQEYALDGISIKVLDSTDIGVAYLVDVDGLSVFHAGDLNWWHWEGEKDSENFKMGEKYISQIDLIKNRPIDIAFVPLDPRLEKHYLLGLDYFMKNTATQIVFPMHFGDDYSVFKDIEKDGAAAGYLNKVMKITRRGEKFEYKK